MAVSAELRWFWQGDAPPVVSAWFHHGDVPAGGGQVRTDVYLRSPGSIDLGVKARGGGGVEVKGCLERRAAAPPPFAAPIEIWAKWDAESLRLDHFATVRVTKRRRLRKFDTSGRVIAELPLDAHEQPRGGHPLPDHGCQVELVAISRGEDGEPWTSLAFEAFGPLPTVEDSLRRTLASLPPPPPGMFDHARAMGYPAWLEVTGGETR